MRLDSAAESREPFFDVFDAHSAELCAYWEPLFGRRGSDFKESIRREFDFFESNLMILDHVEVLPNHRGKSVGLAVAFNLIEMFGGGCGLVACKPFPLQLSGAEELKSGFSPKMKLADLDRNPTRAMRRIREHWSKLGFTRVGRSPIYALSLSNRRPTIEKIIDQYAVR